MPYCDPRVFAEKNQGVYDAYIRTLGRFTAHLIRHGCAVALLSGDIGVDPMAVEDLQRALKNEGISAVTHSLTAERVGSTQDLLARLSAVDYVITSRFHGVVFAHLLNKPVVALSHHPKVAALMNDLGLAKYCVSDLHTFDDEQLAQTFQALVDDQDGIRSRMAERLAAYRGRLAGQFDELFPENTL
jgi:polysaccharide pyruvyl transferase WcaK-like protein